MIIRTQNKTGIVNFDRVDTICTKIINPMRDIKKQYETSVQYYCGNEETIGELGRYSSEEKAIKVLSLMCDVLRLGGRMFQMPQDCEVEE